MYTAIVFLSGLTIGSLFHEQIVSLKNKLVRAWSAGMKAFHS